MFNPSFYRLMAEIGLLASGNNMMNEALSIFDMLEASDIHQEIVVVGRGYSFINAHQYDNAVAVLREYCMHHPPGLSHFLLGLSFKKLGLAYQADSLQKQLCDSADDNMSILAKAIRQVD